MWVKVMTGCKMELQDGIGRISRSFFEEVGVEGAFTKRAFLRQVSTSGGRWGVVSEWVGAAEDSQLRGVIWSGILSAKDLDMLL